MVVDAGATEVVKKGVVLQQPVQLQADNDNGYPPQRLTMEVGSGYHHPKKRYMARHISVVPRALLVAFPRTTVVGKKQLAYHA
ncbi:MAG: hypothetical protein ACRYFV_14805 [Janthinobacterium lividum]